MSKDKDDKLETVAFHVVKMLEGIPKDLVDLFTPNSEETLAQLEINIIIWLARSKVRENIMQLQKQHDLPLRPNQSLRDVAIRIKISEAKKKQQFKDNNSDDEDYPSSGKG